MLLKRLPKYYQHARRKSLSETCLLTNAQARQLQRENSQASEHREKICDLTWSWREIQVHYIRKLDQEVDAYGLPKLTNKVPKRSVSLIRWASHQMRIDDSDKFQGFPGCQEGYAAEEWQRGDSVSLTIRNYFQLRLLLINLAQVQQRSIRKETRSTRREEFKAKFESASVTSLHYHSSLLH